MSSYLIRAGRFWLNPRHVISVEERGAGPAILLPSGNHMIVKMRRGDTIDLWGSDADDLRNSLEGGMGGDAERPDESGSGPGPRIARKAGG